MKPIKPAIAAITELLQRTSLDAQDEKHAQAQLSGILESLAVKFEQEYPLGDGIVDFYFPESGLALELKALTKQGKMDVYRQCRMYCKDERVKGIVLATGRHQGLPDTIEGKPAAVCALGTGGL
ncbi:hypothetical protein [Vibrio mediterranei]|uniref:hypothetical protein n=1 Tax=Vibrio mediterranei TaxID=689 RepID=UPI0040684713